MFLVSIVLSPSLSSILLAGLNGCLRMCGIEGL
jgi:hypothetical protein